MSYEVIASHGVYRRRTIIPQRISTGLDVVLTRAEGLDVQNYDLATVYYAELTEKGLIERPNGLRLDLERQTFLSTPPDANEQVINSLNQIASRLALRVKASLYPIT